MRRRKFIKLSSALVVSGCLPNQGCKPEDDRSGSEKPNILYLMTDQHYAGAMSCAGNEYLNTPAIDSIAEYGVRFDRAYCSNPLCVPSRAVMMTGLMPHETGVTYNMRPKDEGFSSPIMGSILSEGGYDCGYVGKWHLPVLPEQKEAHGFRFLRHARDNNLDDDVPAACLEFLKQERHAPFLLVASFVNPHDICEWAREEDLKNGEIPEAPFPDECPPLPGNFEMSPLEPDILGEIKKKSTRTYPTADWQAGRWRQYLWAYNRLVEKVDAKIAIILDALRKSGLEESTVIIFSSDHGDGVGGHHWNQKQVLYEQSTRVPFIISQKGATVAGRVDREHLVSAGEDLIPTMCSYADIEPPKTLRGRSLRRLAEGREARDWRNYLVVETEFGNFGESFGVSGRMLRTSRHKYIIYSHGEPREQLFDLEIDPGETNNLIESREHQKVLTEHRADLTNWCEETADPFMPYLISDERSILK